MTTPTSSAIARRRPNRTRPGFLRAVLFLDAAVSGLNGVLYLVAAPVLADLFDLDAVLIRWLGGFLLLYAAAVYSVGSRRPIPRGPAWLVVAANGAWVLVSGAVALTGWGSPSAAGTAWIVAQAVAVAWLGVLQAPGLRASRLLASRPGCTPSRLPATDDERISASARMCPSRATAGRTVIRGHQPSTGARCACAACGSVGWRNDTPAAPPSPHGFVPPDGAPLMTAPDKPEIERSTGPAPTELEVTDLVVGDGDEAATDATVQVHYVGVEYDSGKQFDASYDRGAPIEFPLRGLIKGWQDGIPGMRVGGRRKLVCPPQLAYGPAGGGHRLSGQTLVFVIDLLAVR